MIKELVNGNYLPQYVDFPSMMRIQIKKHSLFLQPLFEAFSNSLEALRGNNNSITVRIKQAKASLYNETDLQFVSLEVFDTGEGFNEASFKRFIKLFDGSKNLNNFGTGRVQYLHFFGHTEINSIYQEGNEKKKRRLVLSPDFWEKHESVLWVGNPVKAEDNDRIGTSIEFYYPRDDEDAKKLSALSTQEIRDSILLRYLGRFCLDKQNLPIITIEQYINNVHNRENDTTIISSDIPDSDYSDNFVCNYKKVKDDGEGFETLAQTERFYINAYLLPASLQKKNEVKLTSKNETVDAANVDFSFVSKASKIKDKYMLCLISGDYLTEQDSDVRGKIKIYTQSEYLKKRNFWDSHTPMIFVDDIQREASSMIISHYPQIKKANDKIENSLNEVIEVFALDRTIIEKMGRVTGETTSDFISRYTQYNADVEAKGKAKMMSAIDSLKSLNPSAKTFKKELQKQVGVITRMIPEKNRVSLAKYVAERKSAMVILDRIIHKQLEAQKNIENKKRKTDERLIHDLLFKQRTDNPANSNLWMLNEDFIHFQGTSERMLRDIMIGDEKFLREDLTEEEEAQLTNYHRDYLGSRLDILLFPAEHKCIIIELKSLDADVSKFIGQVTRYASLIRKYAKDKFEITNFYSYLIGENFDFQAAIDVHGNFQVSPNLEYLYDPDITVNGGYGPNARSKGTMYMEVLKYSTLLAKAKLRNKAFTNPLFDGLMIQENGLTNIQD